MAKRQRYAPGERAPAGRLPRAPEEEPRGAERRKKFFSSLAAFLGATGLLTALTSLVITRGFDGLLDSGKDLTGRDPLSIYLEREAEGTSIDPGTNLVFANQLPEAVAVGQLQFKELFREFQKAGAVAARAAVQRVTVENTRSDTAVITSITALVHRKAEPLDGALVVVGPGGGTGEGPVELHFDLDAIDLSAQTYENGKFSGPFLDKQGITLAPGEKLRFLLVGHSASRYVEWSVRFAFVVGGRERSLEVRPPAGFMRVSGLSAGYGQTYRWTGKGLARVPQERLCGKDCRTEPWMRIGGA